MRFDKSFDTLGFWVVIQCIFSLFLIASWTISASHLRLEQEWSGELQKMVSHDMHIISCQNKYIDELEKILTRTKIRKHAPRLFITKKKEN